MVQSLQTQCHNVISQNFEIEKELFYLGVRGNLGYTFGFEKLIKKTYKCVRSRYMRDEKSFEKWFRKEVIKTLDLIMVNRRNPKRMIYYCESLQYRIECFKRVFGIVEEVYAKLCVLWIALKCL